MPKEERTIVQRGPALNLEGILPPDGVEWTLHPTFPNPIRKIHDRTSKFRLETGGWGVFQIVARVQMKDGKQTKLGHYLKLHYPDGTQTTA